VSNHAIEAMYRQHSFAVFRRCRQLTRCEALAQELTQEVFVRVLEAPDAFAGRASPSTYLYAIATNLCLNRLRNDRRRGDAWQDAVVQHWQHTHGAEALDGQLGARQIVRHVLAEADPEVAFIALSYYVDGLAQGEIGALLGLSRVTVNQRLGRFVERARQRWGACA
jgi:RNA polymerase sigma factor (sigma-70 family)